MKNLKKQIHRVHEAMEICGTGDVYDILSLVHADLQELYRRIEDSINGIKEEPSTFKDIEHHVGTWEGDWEEIK